MNESRVEHHNPPELPQSPAFTQAVSVSGPVKTVYVGGQDAVNAAGEIVGEGDLGAQTEQILRNLEAALAAAGARPEHVVKLNISVVPNQSLQAGFEAFARVWGGRVEPPVISVAIVAGLGHPAWLAEIDAVAVVPE